MTALEELALELNHHVRDWNAVREDSPGRGGPRDLALRLLELKLLLEQAAALRDLGVELRYLRASYQEAHP